MELEAIIDNDVVKMKSMAAMGTQPDVLTKIYKPEHNIVVWQRELPHQLMASISEMLADNRDVAIASIVTPVEVGELIRKKFGNFDCVDYLSDDIALIVDMFCCLFEVTEVGLRLTVLERPMCPKFHVDQVPCRLVTTYVGRGTQWLSEPISESASRLDEGDAEMHSLSTGDIALLKGGGWQGNEDNALVHRSPEVQPNERRLLLTLDMV